MLDASKWLDTASKVVPVSVITGIGGYFARIFQAEGRKKHMREQLYREISNNYQRIVVRIALGVSVSGLGAGTLLRFNEKLDLSFSVWNFYNDEKRREMLFDLEEAEAISRIYTKYSNIGNEGLPGYAHVRGKEAAAEVDDLLLDKTLDRKLYQKVSSPNAWKFIDDLLNGRRESYRASLNPL
jgi:hypothetical protein